MATTELAGTTERSVTILVNNREVVVPQRTTGTTIKANADVPGDFQLFVVHGTNEDHIDDAQTIEVHPGERFIASPPLNPS